MTENITPEETYELSEQDKLDLQTLAEQPVNHTLLEIWDNILSNIEAVAAEKVSPIVANKIVSSWPKLSYPDTALYHTRYHDILTMYRQALRDKIAENPGCFKNIGEVGSETGDAFANRQVYIDLIVTWQRIDNRLQDEWTATDPNSHVEIAAIADAAAFVVGPQGLIQHLSQPQVGFEWSAEDQVALEAQLSEEE